jgi:hypothetical protein
MHLSAPALEIWLLTELSTVMAGQGGSSVINVPVLG